MAWSDEQDRLVRPGYLEHLPAADVFAELKRLSQTLTSVHSPYKHVEPVLLHRGEPLINLALGLYGTDEDVYRTLYQFTLEPLRGEEDARLKHGIRVACLSNEALSLANFGMQFPEELVGGEEVRRLLADGTDQELEALVSNPAFDAGMMQSMFSLQPPLSEHPEKRQLNVLHLTARNPRIDIEKGGYESPDREHYAIHKGIFTLLEVAPVDMSWYRVVDNVIRRLDPAQVYAPPRLDHVLGRWRKLRFTNYNGDAVEEKGYYTALSRAEELVCYIAALYGQTYKDGKMAIIGDANSEDVAHRCAWYAHAGLELNEMKAGKERDGNAYVMAACFNSNIMRDPVLKRYFEKRQLNGNLQYLYNKFLKFAQKKYPHIEDAQVEWLRDEKEAEDNGAAANARVLEQIKTTLDQLKALTEKWQSEVQTAAVIAVVVFIIYSVSSWWSGR